MNVVDDCKKYLGISPYDGWTNVVVNDVYFYMDMCKRYGEEIVNKTIKALNKNFKR